MVGDWVLLFDARSVMDTATGKTIWALRAQAGIGEGGMHLVQSFGGISRLAHVRVIEHSGVNLSRRDNETKQEAFCHRGRSNQLLPDLKRRPPRRT